MKKYIGITLIALGIIFGIYVGVWVCFIGGIIDLVNVYNTAIKIHQTVEPMTIAIGIIKILFASFCGTMSAIICIIPGWFMLKFD